LFSALLNGAMLLVVDLLSGLRLLVTLPPPRNVIGGGSSGAEVIQLKCVLLRRVCGGIAVMDRVGRTVLQFNVLGRSMTTAATTALAGWDDTNKSTTDTMVWHLASLIEWERRQRDNITTLAGMTPTMTGTARHCGTTNTTTTRTMMAA
jgi:hypothetical protein